MRGALLLILKVDINYSFGLQTFAVSIETRWHSEQIRKKHFTQFGICHPFWWKVFSSAMCDLVSSDFTSELKLHRTPVNLILNRIWGLSPLQSSCQDFFSSFFCYPPPDIPAVSLAIFTLPFFHPSHPLASVFPSRAAPFVWGLSSRPPAVSEGSSLPRAERGQPKDLWPMWGRRG